MSGGRRNESTEQEDEEDKTPSGGLSFLRRKVSSDADYDDDDKNKNNSNGSKEGGGFFRGVFRRVTGRKQEPKDKSDQATKRTSAQIMEAEKIRYSRTRSLRKKTKKEKKKKKQDKVLGLRKRKPSLPTNSEEKLLDEFGTNDRANPIVAAFDNFEKGFLSWTSNTDQTPSLSQSKETPQMGELRQQVQKQRKERQEELVKRKQLETLELKLRDQKRRESLAKSKAEAEAKKTVALQQKLQYDRQRDILKVIKQGSGDSAELQRERRNVQSVPQTYLSRIRNNTGSNGNNNETEALETEPSISFPNPIGAAQRLVSGVWDNTFGRDDGNDLEEWAVVFPVRRIDPGEVVPVNIGGIDLLVVANVDGTKLYCIENSCSHLGTPLETGVTELRTKSGQVTTDPKLGSKCIVCPLHQTAFDLETGEVRGEWCPYPPVLGKMVGTVKAKTPIAVFDIRTRDKNVEVRINSSLEQPKEKPGRGHLS